MTDPHEMFEAFVAEAIAKSPEPLKELGKFLSEQLDDDAWKTADRLLLQLAALQPSSAADAKAVASESEQTVRVLAEAHKTIRAGAPGLSDQTCNVLAGIIARKVSIIYAQPQPSQQAGTEAWFKRLTEVREGRSIAYAYDGFPHKESTFRGDLGKALAALQTPEAI